MVTMTYKKESKNWSTKLEPTFKVHSISPYLGNLLISGLSLLQQQHKFLLYSNKLKLNIGHPSSKFLPDLLYFKIQSTLLFFFFCALSSLLTLDLSFTTIFLLIFSCKPISLSIMETCYFPGNYSQLNRKKLYRTAFLSHLCHVLTENSPNLRLLKF